MDEDDIFNNDLIQNTSKDNKKIVKKNNPFTIGQCVINVIQVILALYSLTYSILMPTLELIHDSEIDPKKDNETFICLWISLCFLFAIYNILIIISIINYNKCIFDILIGLGFFSFILIFVNMFFYIKLNEKIKKIFRVGFTFNLFINCFLLMGIIAAEFVLVILHSEKKKNNLKLFKLII